MVHARHCRGWSRGVAATSAALLVAACAALLVATPAAALDVSVVGIFPGKAVLVLDRGAPRTVAIGQRTVEGVSVVAIDAETATVTLEIDGRRRAMKMGQHYASPITSGEQKAVIAAGTGGHFVTEGKVNGGTVRFMVDTGATSIALPGQEARRLGINYLAGQRGITQTASGTAPVWRVTLDAVTVGGITLNSVEAVVIESGLGIPLLGMSFLSRTSMLREGETLTLVKRF